MRFWLTATRSDEGLFRYLCADQTLRRRVGVGAGEGPLRRGGCLGGQHPRRARVDLDSVPVGVFSHPSDCQLCNTHSLLIRPDDIEQIKGLLKARSRARDTEEFRHLMAGAIRDYRLNSGYIERATSYMLCSSSGLLSAPMATQYRTPFLLLQC